MVRKILYLLFSVVFLLVFVSFFSQKSLADSCTYSDTEAAGGSLPITQAFTKAFDATVAKCKSAWPTTVDSDTSAVNNCVTNNPSYQTINSDAAVIIGSNSYAAGVARSKYCAVDPNSHGYVTNCTVTLTATCPNGTKNAGGSTSTGSIPVGQSGCSFQLDSKRTPLITCQNGGLCAPIGGNVNTSVTPNTYEHGFCVDTQNKCPVCPSGYQPNFNSGKCSSIEDSHAPEVAAGTPISCAQDEGCTPGIGCSNGSKDQTPPLSLCKGTCDTALGPLPTDLPGLLTRIFSIALSIAGIAALGLIIASGYRLMVSQGNPEQVKGAREQLTAAIIGLLFIIFSLVILQIIGVNILKIPGFG
jgi:hypothetical protein